MSLFHASLLAAPRERGEKTVVGDEGVGKNGCNITTHTCFDIFQHRSKITVDLCLEFVTIKL